MTRDELTRCIEDLVQRAIHDGVSYAENPSLPIEHAAEILVSEMLDLVDKWDNGEELASDDER